MTAALEQPSEARPREDFKEQMLELLPSLRAFARGLCRDRDLADDLTQEAMVKAWAARDSFTPGTNFRAWMYMILRNQFYTVMRKNARVAPWDPEAAERLLVAPAGQESVIHLAELQQAMDCLPAPQREMLMLVAAAGLSYEEAAEVTGCALGTVKSRVARARTALTRMIEGEESVESAVEIPVG